MKDTYEFHSMKYQDSPMSKDTVRAIYTDKGKVAKEVIYKTPNSSGSVIYMTFNYSIFQFSNYYATRLDMTTVTRLKRWISTLYDC